MILRLREFLHGRAGAVALRPGFPTLTNVAASQTKYAHISGIKIDKIMKILESIDIIK